MNPIAAERNKKELQTIQQAQTRVDTDIVLVDAEVTKLGIDNLKEGQIGQQEQLKNYKRSDQGAVVRHGRRLFKS